MSCRRWRLSVFLLVTLISVSLFSKSRTLPEKKRAAFLRFTTGSILIKVKGREDKDGVYRIFDAEKSECANKMTFESIVYKLKSNPAINCEFENGAVLEVSAETFRVSAERMTAVELIMLRIPLDPKLMTVADWESLPGIGPVIASEIIYYSQKNGGIASIDELGALSGIGDGKLRKIKSFFR